MTDFLREELPAHLYQRGHDTDALMEESQLEAQKRQEVIRMYQACKEALQIITDANLDGLQMDASRMAINPSPVPRPAPVPPQMGGRPAPMPPGMMMGPPRGPPPPGARPAPSFPPNAGAPPP